MPKIDVYDIEGKKVKTIELKEEVFGIEPNEAVVHSVLVNYLANQRQGTQSTKTRAEVSGGGRKPWRQKGTGRARQGSIRAPQWIKGGIALGPKPRSYKYTVNKKERQLAVKSVLSSKAEVAKQETEIADEKEKINLSALAAQANNEDAVIRRNDFDKELKKFFNEDYILEPDSDAEEYEVTCKKSGRKYTIKSGITKKNPDYELNNNNTTFSSSPSGWTNSDVIVNVKTTIQEYTLQTSKDGKNWNDSKEQVFSTNGIMYARLWNGSESVSELQYEVNNIDKSTPEVSATAINTNSIKISASDSESGIIGYAVTTSSTKPENFTGVMNTKSFENSISKLAHNTTYYVWIKDEAGNTSQYSLKTPELKAGSLKLSKAMTQKSDASDVANNIGSYIGSTVTNYTPNGGDKNVGWKIFYAGKSDAGDSSENDHIYLIADDLPEIGRAHV